MFTQVSSLISVDDGNVGLTRGKKDESIWYYRVGCSNDFNNGLWAYYTGLDGLFGRHVQGDRDND